MELKKEERKKLEQYKNMFKLSSLTKEQMELILGRKITIPKLGYRRSSSKTEGKKKKLENRKGQQYSIKQLFKEPEAKERLSTE
jgi:hypothetical protein